MTTKRKPAGVKAISPRRLFLYLAYDGNQELGRFTASNLDEAERKAAEKYPMATAEVRRLHFPGRPKRRAHNQNNVRQK